MSDNKKGKLQSVNSFSQKANLLIDDSVWYQYIKINSDEKIIIGQYITLQSCQEQNFKPFNYQLIEECSISQYEYCLVIAIYQDCSTLMAGCNYIIKVFEFNEGKIKQIQSLNQHKDDVLTLNFLKKSKQFISGSRDQSIIIWKLNQNNQWSSQSILNGHDNWVQCLIINTNKDLIISGSNDKTIKFWIKRINGCVNKQLFIILKMYQDQVQINNKIELYLVEMIKIY